MFLGAFVGRRGQRRGHAARPAAVVAGPARPVSGVAAVKVAPEHRDRGIGRSLMTKLRNLIADRGYLLSALYPATMPIYRSLGWELAGARHRVPDPGPFAARSRRTR